MGYPSCLSNGVRLRSRCNTRFRILLSAEMLCQALKWCFSMGYPSCLSNGVRLRLRCKSVLPLKQKSCRILLLAEMLCQAIKRCCLMVSFLLNVCWKCLVIFRAISHDKKPTSQGTSSWCCGFPLCSLAYNIFGSTKLFDSITLFWQVFC